MASSRLPQGSAPPRRRLRLLRALLRWLGLGAALLLVLAVLGTVAVRLWVTPETVKARLAAELQRAFRRPVSIGRVAVRPYQGIVVHNLTVSEAPGFPGKVFLSSERFFLKYRFRALLEGRLEITELLLEHPRIRLARRADGAWNFQDLLRRADAPAPARGRFALPPLSVAQRISLEGGRVTLADELRRVRLTVDELAFSATNLNADEPFEVHLAFANDARVGGRRIRSKALLDGVVAFGGFDPARASVSVGKLELEVDGKPVAGSGAVRNFRRPELEATLKLPALDSATLGRYQPVPEGIALPASRWELRARAPEAAASTAAAAALPFVYELLPSTAVLGPVTLHFSGLLPFDGGKAELRLATSGAGLDQLAAVYTPWAERRVEGRVSYAGARLGGPLGELKLISLNAGLRGVSLALTRNTRAVDADLDVTASDRGRTLDIRVPRGTYVLFSNALTNLDARARLARGDLAFEKLDFTWNDAQVRLRGCVKDLSQLEKVFFDGTVDKVRVNDLYATVENVIAQKRAQREERGERVEKGGGWASVFRLGVPDRFPDLMGRLRWAEAGSPNFSTQNVQIDADLRGIARGLETVDGSFRIGFGPGRINNVESVQKVNTLLNVLILPFAYMHSWQKKALLSVDTAALKTLDITRTFGDFGVRQGAVDVRYIHFDSPQFAGLAEGKADFSSEKVDLKVLLRGTKASGQLAERLVDTAGRPALELKVQGDLNKPDAQPTLRKMQGDDIENALSRALGRSGPLPALESKLGCGGEAKP